MAQLLVRDLDETLVRLLRQRAAVNNRSAEAEHRAILEKALMDGEPIWDVAKRLQQETAGHTASDSTEIVRHYRDTR